MLGCLGTHKGCGITCGPGRSFGGRIDRRETATPDFLSSEANLWQLVLLAFVSLVVGVVGGFIGLALGLVRLPVLLLLGFPLPLVAGTNLLVTTLSIATGAFQHLRDRRVQWLVVATMGIPSVAGSLVGGLASDQAPESALITLIAVLVTVQGAVMVVRARRLAERYATEGARSAAGADLGTGRHTAAATIGLGAGLVGGAIGLVLGSIRLPAMVSVLRMNPRIAVGTGAVIGLLMGIFGFIGHGVQGHIDVPILISMGGSAVIGTYYGAKLSGRAPVGTLALVMGLVLLGVGGSLFIEVFAR
ncbi:MAG: sulfite exporter TauE/SafE family protein [Dehalococcoidia bacterium]